jgi:putative ABC transport system permease protein
MSLATELRYRLRRLLNRDAVEAELAAEVNGHIERETEKLISQGIPRPEAERRARLAFGSVERIKDETRDSHGTMAIEGMIQDLRYAARGLRARPSFTLGILLTLGLGIGANAAMFGVIDRVLVRPPAMMRDASHVHRLYRQTAEVGEPGPRYDRNFAFATYLDLKRDLTDFSDVAAFQTITAAVGDGEQTREMRVTVASANYFTFFDARPALGRFFTAAEDSVPSGSAVAVLGYNFWQTRYGGREVLGEQIRIGRFLYTIVGVAPKHFTGMSDQSMPTAFIPISNYAFVRRGAGYPSIYTWSWLEVIARRKPGVSPEAATANATQGFIASWRNAFAAAPGWGPPEKRKVQGVVAPVLIERGPQAGRDSKVALWIGGVALIVLLIACANVANLMLARAVSRKREIAMRLALGVSRGRLTRQLLTESGLLAVAGGIAGLVVARYGGGVIRSLFLPPEFGDAVVTDGRTLAFTTFATLAAALLTGLVPAWNAGRGDVVSALKAGAGEGGGRRSNLRAGLLVFQAALSVLLLVGAGLFVRSLTNARGVRLGYDTDSLMIAEVNLRGATLDAVQMATLMPRFLDAARATPGVTNAAFGASAPFMSNDQMPIFVPGLDSAFLRGRFLVQFVGPGYFATMGTRVLSGRALDERDVAGGEPVVVISEGMAKVLWPGRDAVGQCMRFNRIDSPCRRIVGIAENIRLRNFQDPREFTYYVPASQFSGDGVEATTLFVRTASVASGTAPAVRARLQAILPAPAYVNVIPMSRAVDPSFRAWRFAATMFLAFGGLALALAAIGLYSLVAYDVAQRVRDMSLRLALGATGPNLVGHVVGGGLRLIGIGVAIGAAAAWWAAPRAQALMFRQEALDPKVFLGVAAVLVAVGILAAIIPAIRASRVDPALMLRVE